MTRVTQSLISRQALQNLQASLSRTGKLQERLSTGRQLNRPSDSPTGLVTAMQVRAQQTRTAQYLRNADSAIGWLNTTDSALQGASQLLNRARDLAVQGSNSGAIGEQGREAIAQELVAIKENLLQIANQTYNGRALFNGTTQAIPVFADGTSAEPYKYLGNEGAVTRALGASTMLTINVTGSLVFGDGDDSTFEVLDDLAEQVRGGQPVELERLDAARDKVLHALGEIGTRTNRVENLKALAEEEAYNLEISLTEVENIDLPETIMALQMQEVSYQAALAATSRVLQPSLLDFLR